MMIDEEKHVSLEEEIFFFLFLFFFSIPFLLWNFLLWMCNFITESGKCLKTKRGVFFPFYLHLSVLSVIIRISYLKRSVKLTSKKRDIYLCYIPERSIVGKYVFSSNFELEWQIEPRLWRRQ